MTKYEANELKNLVNKGVVYMRNSNIAESDTAKGYYAACANFCNLLDEYINETTDIEQPCTYAISKAALLKAIDDKSFYCNFMKDCNGDSESLWGCDFVEVDEIIDLINSMPNVLEQNPENLAYAKDAKEEYQFPYVLSEPCEMYVNGEWKLGKIVDGYRFRDGLVTIRTNDGKEYWCAACRTELYRKPNSTNQHIPETQYAIGDLCEICVDGQWVIGNIVELTNTVLTIETQDSDRYCCLIKNKDMHRKAYSNTTE